MTWAVNAIRGMVPEIRGRHGGGGTPTGGGLSDYTAGANGRRLYEDSRQAIEDASRPVSMPHAPPGAPPVARELRQLGGSAGTPSSRHIHAEFPRLFPGRLFGFDQEVPALPAAASVRSLYIRGHRSKHR
jgi:hypothetical protein